MTEEEILQRLQPFIVYPSREEREAKERQQAKHGINVASSSHLQRMKQARADSVGNQCEVCYAKSTPLLFHHITYVRFGEEKEAAIAFNNAIPRLGLKKNTPNEV